MNNESEDTTKKDTNVVALRKLILGLPLAVVGGVLGTLPWTAFAETPLPQIPEARAKAGAHGCVEPVDEMRKNHMNYILHQRDLTMHEGIRTKQHSLVECISCHVTPGRDGTYPSHNSSDHFCGTCHEYAAVTIDCFECHTSRPQGAQQVGASPASPQDNSTVDPDLLAVQAQLQLPEDGGNQ
ncbi:MAG: hypothetical protein JSW10_06270 [Pseudomonadota bacterium]|nr:MAG: hypothetical protein JSW10_06270 [Pseudomonadota bacterium]